MERRIKPVKTPMPEADDGSGYTTEENHLTIYDVGSDKVEVRKVSDVGWSVWVKETDDGEQTLRRKASGLNGQEAERLGRIEAIKVGQ